MKVVIVGGGIMGCATAYYLSQKSTVSQITIVERNKAIAECASGKAGGFLAKYWCDGTKVQELARMSFDLHQELANKFENIGYRRLDTINTFIATVPRKTKSEVLPWLFSDKTFNAKPLGSTDDTAQVHPQKLSLALAAASKAQIITGVQVEMVSYLNDTSAQQVILSNGTILDADAVVFCMGPWTSHAHAMLPMQAQAKFPLETLITGSRAHSIVLQPTNPQQITANAVFCECAGSPEIYPRPDGTVYICGYADNELLPDNPSHVKPSEEACNKLVEFAKLASPALDGAQVIAKQCCYLPYVSDNGVPLIGKVPLTSNVYIAAGHTCWGILNGPGTGKVLADLIVDGKTSLLNASVFDPQSRK